MNSPDGQCRKSDSIRPVNGVKKNGVIDQNGSIGKEKAACAHENMQNGQSLITAGDRCAHSSYQQQSCTAGVKTMSLEEMDLIILIGHILARDIVSYVSSKGLPGQPKPCGIHASIISTLRRTVDQVSDRHEILFASIVKKLHIGEEGTNCESFGSVADEMFADKHYNWGRIVTLYAFAGWLAKHCVDNRIDGDWVNRIGEVCGDYVAENLSQWIASQGGWVSVFHFLLFSFFLIVVFKSYRTL